MATLICDECGSGLRLVHTREEVDYYDLPGDAEAPNARQFIAQNEPDDGDEAPDRIEVECAINYSHATGWAMGASGYVERVEELTNDGP